MAAAAVSHASCARTSTTARTGRPWVVLKLAATLDGRVAAPDGSSQWITGPAARVDAHRLRAESDAILVGAGTVRTDDPTLTVRDWPPPETPRSTPTGSRPPPSRAGPGPGRGPGAAVPRIRRRDSPTLLDQLGCRGCGPADGRGRPTRRPRLPPRRAGRRLCALPRAGAVRRQRCRRPVRRGRGDDDGGRVAGPDRRRRPHSATTFASTCSPTRCCRRNRRASLHAHAEAGAAQGFAREGDPGALRGRRPPGRALVVGRLQGHRSPTRGSIRCGSCGPRRSRRMSPTGCSTSGSPAATGSRRPAATSRRSGSCGTRRPPSKPVRIVHGGAGRLARGRRVADLPNGVRVSTEYPEITRRFFDDAGVEADVRLSYGATEAKVPDIVDVVVDITETGRALQRGRPPDHRHARHLLHRADRQSGVRSPTRRRRTRWARSTRCCRACSTPGARCW